MNMMRERLVLGRVTVELDRGYVATQFIRNCYTLQVATRLPGSTTWRYACWEFSRCGTHPRFLGYQTTESRCAHLRGELERGLGRLYQSSSHEEY
jgi:hypothetical protein